MKLENALRGVAGVVVLLSAALAAWVSPYWLLLTAFAGVNLLQSAFTDWCPMKTVLSRLGVGRVRHRNV